MRTKIIHRSLGLLMLALVILLSEDQAFSKNYTQKGYTLAVTVLDAKNTICSGQRTVISGVRVSIRPNLRTAVWRSELTDSTGTAKFTNVIGGLSYSISFQKYVEGVGSLCDPKTITYSMPNESAQTTVALNNCWTTSNYDISARFLGASTDAVTAGNSYRLSFVLKNNGVNGPSRSNNVRLVRYYGDAEGSRVTIGSPNKVPELCVNQEMRFDVTDTQLTVGGWIYTLEWDSGPDQGVTVDNHRPRKTVGVRAR